MGGTDAGCAAMLRSGSGVCDRLVGSSGDGCDSGGAGSLMAHATSFAVSSCSTDTSAKSVSGVGGGRATNNGGSSGLGGSGVSPSQDAQVCVCARMCVLVCVCVCACVCVLVKVCALMCSLRDGVGGA